MRIPILTLGAFLACVALAVPAQTPPPEPSKPAAPKADAKKADAKKDDAKKDAVKKPVAKKPPPKPAAPKKPEAPKVAAPAKKPMEIKTMNTDKPDCQIEHIAAYLDDEVDDAARFGLEVRRLGRERVGRPSDRLLGQQIAEQRGKQARTQRERPNHVAAVHREFHV